MARSALLGVLALLMVAIGLPGPAVAPAALDSEKWIPVFGKDHAPTKALGRRRDSTISNPAVAESAQIKTRRAAERTEFSDKEIADGFFKLAFGAEMHRGGRVDRIRKYDGPVRVFIENRGRPDRLKQVRNVVADIKSLIANLDLDFADKRENANVVITLVRERDLGRTIRNLYGGRQSRLILRSLEPQCLSGFRKDESFRILRSNVILVTDIDEFTFFDCAYEEILQALGPINDDSTVPWTMFNDDVQKGYFDIYDQYILNILYDPRIRPGMRPDQVRALLPEILPTVRAFVAKATRK